jgi:outer membrane lipase/esterase
MFPTPARPDPSAAVPRSRSRSRGRASAAAALAALVLGLAACGGGGESRTVFVPTRVLAFGDDASVIDSTGRKYTVNAISATTGALDCVANPIWVQTLATGSYGLVFPECNPNAVPGPTSRILAEPGARVAGVRQQVDRQIAAGGFREGDLVTVMAGVHDVLDAFAQFPATPVAALVGQVDAAGRELGRQVNRMVEGGARVLVSTAIDPTFAPFGRAADPTAQLVDCPRVQGETERLPLMTCLTDRLNGAMRTTIFNDGRRVGLVLGDALVRSYLQLPVLGGFSNVSDAACAATAPLPTCTTATLAGPDAAGRPASASSWLWASGVQLSPGGHGQLGSAAVSRARTNPF